MNKTLLIILMSCVFQTLIIGQSVTQLESKLSSLQKIRAEMKTELDSLKIIYEVQIRRIDQEKNHRIPDKKKITQLMSEALSVSDQLEKKKKEMSGIESDLKTIRKELNQKYSDQIDSLQALVNSKEFQGDEALLQTRILQLSEKRLLVSPIVKKLFFDPGKILQIHPEQYTDSLEAAIYSDYLTNALAEIDTQLNRVRSSRQEYEEIIKLQEKTSDFLDEVAEDQYDGIFLAAENQAQLRNQPTLSDPIFGGEYSTSESGIIYAQFQSYLAILNQLNRNGQIQQQSYWNSPVDSGSVTLTMKDYVQLLKDVEQELRSYKKIIQNKLKP